MDSEIIRAVQKHKRTRKDRRQKEEGPNIGEDDLYKEVIKPLKAEFSDPIVAPHWWKKPADNFKGFAEKTRINNTIWRQWYVHFVRGKETVVKFANPMPLANKYHSRVLAVVVEGHYWCRKHSAIRAQYSSWRHSRKLLHPKIKIDNLVVNNKQQEEISSPGGDDLVLSGMLNGFSDIETLDLALQFDLPDFFGNYDNMLNLDSQGQLSEAVPNGYHPPTTSFQLSDAPEISEVRNEAALDTTSLNTLATAANMSEYYQSSNEGSSQYSYRDPGYRSQYSYTACREFAQSPAQQPPQFTVGNSIDGAPLTSAQSQSHYITPTMPVPKGPAYYPPTRLQYCYSDKPEFNDSDVQHSSNQIAFPQLFPNQQPTQPTQPYKQKLSEIEIDRKRRKAMKNRLQNLKQVILPVNLGIKHTQSAILNSAAELLRKEEAQLQALVTEIVRLNSLISQTKDHIESQQGQIPENGISSACFGSSIVESQYSQFLEQQIIQKPLMKLYSTMLEPLFLSFNSMVDNTSLDTFCRTAHQWFAQNCSLTKVRELATTLITSPNLDFENSGVTLSTSSS